MNPDTGVSNHTQGIHRPDKGFTDDVESLRLLREPSRVFCLASVNAALTDVDSGHRQSQRDLLAVAVALAVKAHERGWALKIKTFNLMGIIRR